jgi:hypothetical protein
MKARLKPPGHQERRIFPQPNLTGPSARQAELIEAIGSLHTVMGDMSGLLARMIPAVIAQKTITLDATGTASEQFRVPFASVGIDYFGTALLTVAAHPLQQAAPGPGVGIAKVGPGGFAVVNFRANVLSFYGNPGDQITFSAMAQPQPPNGVLNGTAGALIVAATDYPSGAVPIVGAQSGVNSALSVGLPGVVGKTTYITGFEVTGAGATAAAVLTVSLFNLVGSITGLYTLVIPAGVTTGITPLMVEFAKPIPAFAQNTGITLGVPAFGAGNTNATATAHGYQL